MHLLDVDRVAIHQSGIIPKLQDSGEWQLDIWEGQQWRACVCFPGKGRRKFGTLSCKVSSSRSMVWDDAIKVDGHFTEDDDMPTLSLNVLLRYGCAVLSVGLGACPNICSCSRMAAGFRWALAFSASAQPCAHTIPLNLPRRCRSGARSSKDCGSSISVATRPTLSPGLATETYGFLART